MLGRGKFATSVFALHGLVRSSAAVLQAPHHQPPISGFWAVGAFGSSSCVWCSHVFGHKSQRNLGLWSLQRPPSTSQSYGQKVRAKPSRPDTLKKAKQPRVLKNVTIAQRVKKSGKYGLYDNNGRLYCKPCGKKVDETQKGSLTKHVTSGIHDVLCAKHIQSLYFVLLLIRGNSGNRSAYCWCSVGRGANHPACIR